MFESVKVLPSSDHNVQKFVFVFAGKPAVAEAVLYKYESFEYRAVICCSTQSGCPIGCRFCGAGDNFIRSLTAEEIIAQIQHVLEVNSIDASKIERFQIMFMSMGEPMLNFGNLERACRTLNVLYPNAKLLVSTSGPLVSFRGMNMLSMEIENMGLQFSIHESTDEARNLLIPFKEKYTLGQIAALGEAWHVCTGRPPFFNYCAHENNTSEEDADRLLKLFNPAVWNATISVICERDETVAAANARQLQLAEDFRTKLASRGYTTRVFNPSGQDDIGGGCGQLWFVQNWMKEHPELAHPSIGNGKSIIHTPT